ncbi:unannotated protein [freshwater metagenome]|uniref:Unannotated protein n=1 Tax=freshwater metagenome TaxID=449393 RepID=A0A6J6HIN0_9ZZZZ
MGSIKKIIWVSVLALITSLTFQPTAANAADRCVPDSIGTEKFGIHPGQVMGLLVNGVPIGEECTTTDPGVIALDYVDRNAGEPETFAFRVDSWKWKDLSYEELLSMMRTSGIKADIDAQKLLSFYFYRLKDGTVDANNSTASFAIVLDPTEAGPCHPDLVSFKTDTISLTSSILEILDGSETGIPCTIYDPGWIAFGVMEPGAETIVLSKLYFDKWVWGGKIDYVWVEDMLDYGEIDRSKIKKGSEFELRFFRGGSPETAIADIGKFTFYYKFIIDLPTPEEIAAAKAAADKKIADEKAAADKKIADEKAAADKVIADKAAADKAAADKVIADKAAADKVIADKAAAAAKAKAAAAKKKTITCVKGKLTKKVTAVKPVCPKGYKIKK